MNHLGVRFDDIKLRSRDFGVAHADDTVIVGGRLAHNASREARLRELATRITDGVIRVDINGAEAIARWVRKTIRYRQETPGVEILQGPFTTLRTRVGDCDDLVILWVALCRSIGIDAAFAGVRVKGTSDYVHAMGYLPADRTFVEVTDDRAYGGRRHPLLSGTLPNGHEAVHYDATSERLVAAPGGGAAVSKRAWRLVERPGFGLVAALGVLALLAWRS